MLLLMIFGTAMFASVIPYSAELMALRNLPQQVFSVLMSMEPAIAAIAGWALLNQETGPDSLAGDLPADDRECGHYADHRAERLPQAEG